MLVFFMHPSPLRKRFLDDKTMPMQESLVGPFLAARINQVFGVFLAAPAKMVLIAPPDFLSDPPRVVTGTPLFSLVEDPFFSVDDDRGNNDSIMSKPPRLR